MQINVTVLANWLFVAGTVFLSVLGAGHALLNKRRPPAALGWIFVCLAVPIAGTLLYFLLGINRVHARARRMQHRWGVHRLEASTGIAPPPKFIGLSRISEAAMGLPLTANNTLEMLQNGEEAFPPMLRSIQEAERHVYLASYIFERNATGKAFIAALAKAVERGVHVRVLVDGIGSLYSLPSSFRLMKKRGIPVAKFLPPTLFPPSIYLNLRNHRKLLIADGSVGFTGGMNIGDRQLAGSDDDSRVVDVHFQLTGPIINQMESVFCNDWEFATGEKLNPPVTPDPPPAPDGSLCRVIVDGPDENLDKLTTILVGAVASAQDSVLIMTPYFLPPEQLTSALQTAALRGVDVNVILPEKNNLFYVHWATRNMLWELLQRGVRVFYQPPPFVHSKLFIVDGEYVQVGSANLDPRSLRLNFELNVEIYKASFAKRLCDHFMAVREHSKEVSLEEMDGRSIPVKTRDALAWLLSPYL